MQPKFSEGQEESKMMAELMALVENGWTLDAEQIGVRKTYHFKLYTKVLVGDSPRCHCPANSSEPSPRYRGEKHIGKTPLNNDYCKSRTFLAMSRLRLRHLQEMGSLTVYWTTHDPRGLSAKDTFMARYCDEQAGIIGTVDRSDAAKCGPTPSSQI